MSELSSCNTFESEEENSGWLMSSEASIDEDEDDLSDELTLLNGDENSDDDSILDDDFIKLSQCLKEKYKLQEATVELERCDKIWDTMQLLKNIQEDYNSDNTLTGDDDDNEDDDDLASSRSNSCVLQTVKSAVPYIKYQPVQGNGNNALPNFYLAVKSQRKVYHCVTCGKQYSEKRGLRHHSEKEHGIVLPLDRHKTRYPGETRVLRPKTPSDFGTRGGRDSVADEKISHNSSSRDRDNSKSRLSNSSKQNSSNTEQRRRGRLEEIVKEPTTVSKQTGLRELDELLGLNNNDCLLCDATYAHWRYLYRHSIEVHGLTTAEAKKQLQMKREMKPVVVPKKETFRTRDEGSGRKGTREVRTSREAASRAASLSDASKSSEVKRETSSSDKAWPPRKKKKAYGTKIIDGVKYRCMYTCKTCGNSYLNQKSIKKHALRIHGLALPRFKKGDWTNPSRSNKIFKVELIPADDDMVTMRSSKQIHGNYSKAVDKRKGIDRPKRKCALRTSYTECTKEEEEELQKTLSGVPISPVNKSPPSQTTDCFLCKKSYVDIRRHLVDYHRINSPESVLPLATVDEPEKAKNHPVASAEAVDKRPKLKENKTDKQNEESSPSEDESKSSKPTKKYSHMRVVVDANGRQAFQCTVCLYKYKQIQNLKVHLKRNTVKGVLKDHVAFPGFHAARTEEKDSVSEDSIADPLALTDFSDGSKPNSNSTTSEDEDFRSGTRKRFVLPGVKRSSDERFTPSPEPDKKRRKIEDSETDGDANNGSESRSDSVEESVTQESVIALSDTDSQSVEEVKSANHRDTRDSSDRDSGIGISITIKKRNDSYEIVEKDSGDDDKSKDFENSKDDNLLCSDSSSDVTTPVDFVNYDQKARRREILNSIDCSKDENILGSVRMDLGDVENEKKTDDRCSSNDADNNFHWKEGCYRDEACTNMRGKVPSLKVLCRTVLTTNELSIMSISNNLSISHQCPVCCRFYPTERDVTVHMLEHKVSRSNFRTKRLHSIPISALRRYGRNHV